MCGQAVQATPQEGEYVAKEYKLHHKNVNMWPRSTNYSTRRWVCGQRVKITPQEGEYVAKEYKLPPQEGVYINKKYKLHHKKVSIFKRSTNYATRKWVFDQEVQITSQECEYSISPEIQPTPQEGEYLAKEYKPQEGYVAKKYKLHHKEMSVWSSSKNYTTRSLVCGQAVQLQAIHHKKVSLSTTNTNYSMRLGTDISFIQRLASFVPFS